MAVLSEVGREVVTAFTASLREVATQTLTALNRLETAPKTWKVVLETVRLLHEVIDPQAIEVLGSHASVIARRGAGRAS